MSALAARLGDCLREHRIAANLTQARVAKVAGVSRRHLAALEKGANVSISILMRVSEVLGVPLGELFETKIPISTKRATRYLSAFISYGAPDEAVARRVYEELLNVGVRCFFFPSHAVPGMRLYRSLCDSLRAFDRLVLLCSANSLGRRGVSYEIEQALARELEEGGAELIIPVALDDAVFEGTALHQHAIAQLRQRVIADFRAALTNEHEWRLQFQRILTALTTR